jgi:hypothetical protein
MAAATRAGAGFGRSARAGGERARAARSATTGAGHCGFAAAIAASAAIKASPPGTRRSGHAPIFWRRVRALQLFEG